MGFSSPTTLFFLLSNLVTGSPTLYIVLYRWSPNRKIHWVKAVFGVENIYRTFQLNVLPPLEFKTVYMSVKNFFGTGRKRYIDHHVFMSFSLRERIPRQKCKVYIRADLLYSNLQNFSFYELWSSYKGGNDEKLTRL